MNGEKSCWIGGCSWLGVANIVVRVVVRYVVENKVYCIANFTGILDLSQRVYKGIKLKREVQFII